MRVTKLFFCQIDPPMSASFWQKNRLDTQILFDLCLFEHFSPVANFAQQSIHHILQQNLSFKFTWFFTLIPYCNSHCLFNSIYTSKFTYNPKIINKKMGACLFLPTKLHSDVLEHYMVE